MLCRRSSALRLRALVAPLSPSRNASRKLDVNSLPVLTPKIVTLGAKCFIVGSESGFGGRPKSVSGMTHLSSLVPNNCLLGRSRG